MVGCTTFARRLYQYLIVKYLVISVPNPDRLRKLDARFRRQIFVPLEVVHRHENRAPESSVEFRPMAPICGAGCWSVCHGPYV